MIPRAGEEGRAYTLAVLAMYAVNGIMVAVGVGLWLDGELVTLVEALPEYLLAMMVLGGAAQVPNVAERIGNRGNLRQAAASSGEPTDYGAKTPEDL